MSGTVRLTVAQATVRFLGAQYSERDGVQQRLIAGCFGIFGHGNVAGLGQALLQAELSDPEELPYILGRNEQAMVHSAVAYARMKDRLQTYAVTTSVGPGATWGAVADALAPHGLALSSGDTRSVGVGGNALGASIGQPALTALPVACLTLLAALQERDDYDRLLLHLEELATTYPLGILTDPVHDVTRWAKGVKAAASGDNFGALHHLARFRLPVFARMSALERLESAVRSDETAGSQSSAASMSPFGGASVVTTVPCIVASGSPR